MRPKPGEMLLLLLAASAVNYAGRVAFAIAAPDIRREFGLSEPQLGVLASAFNMAYALLMLPGGWITDRTGARRAMGFGGLLGAALMAGTALGAGVALPLLWLARFGYGAVSAPLYPASTRTAGQWFAEARHALVLGAVIGAGSLGSTIAPLVFVSINQRAGWRWSFYATAAAMAVFFLLWLWRVPPGERQEQGRELSLGNVAAVLGSRQTLWVTAAYFLTGYFYDFFDNWGFYYFREVKQFAPSLSALFSAVLQFSVFVVMPLGGWISDALGGRSPRARTGFLALAAAMSGISFLFGSRAGEPVAALGLLCAAFMLAGSTEGAMWVLATEPHPRHRATAAGLMNTGGILGSVCSSLTLPRLAERFGWPTALIAVCVAMAIACAVWLRLRAAAPALTRPGTS